MIIERKDYDRWLASERSAQPPLDLLRPFPAEQMIAWEVGPAVGNVRNDSAELLAADTQQTNIEEPFLPGFMNETSG